MNSSKQRYFAVVVTAVALFLCGPSGFGYGNEEAEIDTLRGLEMIRVVVDWKGSGIEEGELISDKETIKNVVEQRLRLKGIDVYCSAAPETQPLLCIEIHSLICDGYDVRTLHVLAKVMQKVFLKKKKPIYVMSPTWSSEGEICIVSAGSLRNSVLKQVDEFVSAYLSVNPGNMDHTNRQKEIPRTKPNDTSVQQEAITVDELLKMHATAINYDKMKFVDTMKFSGRMIQFRGSAEIETPYTLLLKRPGYSRFEFTVQGMYIVMAYDGSTVWQVNPLRFRGSLEPELMQAAEAKQIIIDAQLFPSFSSPLIEYKERGHTVELVGIENMNGSRVYKLMATLQFGMTSYWYISSKNYLVPQFTWLAGQHDFGAQGFDVHVLLKEYRDSDGIIFPHVIEDKAAGFTAKKYTVDHAEINTEVDDSIFRMPKRSGH